MLLVPNKNVIVPELAEVTVTAKVNQGSDSRQENKFTITIANQLTILLPFTPVSADWVEIYLNGRRLINPRLSNKAGGTRYEHFNVVGNLVEFTRTTTGQILVVCDTQPTHKPGALVIDVKNIQNHTAMSADATATSLYCEPIVLSQPRHGYARLTQDRQSIAYVPRRGFQGTDSFSYTLITQNGQVAQGRCVFVVVAP